MSLKLEEEYSEKIKSLNAKEELIEYREELLKEHYEIWEKMKIAESKEEMNELHDWSYENKSARGRINSKLSAIAKAKIGKFKIA